ncbi:MAG: hypothetical protein Ct9H300mP9_0510 [Candidatus Neomarinimicrobiota bacterium]|nr:MAG: hypothetical protein Ct9H300mP9_0510 [Candidatus Neomarinimicrobiota bacterium]
MRKKEGARVLIGGKRPDKYEKGYFYEPTVFDQVTPGMEFENEESFSPVIPIQSSDQWMKQFKWQIPQNTD